MSATLITETEFPSADSLDEEEQLDALARGLKRAQGFALFLVCCNQVEKRDSLIEALQQRLFDFTIQRFPVYQNIPHLLDALREGLAKPAPDALFVYGIEAWMKNGESREEAPFILNLNAARNHFRKEVPCPMVMFVPQYILAAIARGAPDFFSVQSGFFAFFAPPEEREGMLQTLTSSTFTANRGLTYQEQQERLKALTKMLHEYEALPDDLRDLLAEARLMDRIGHTSVSLADIKNAEASFRKALDICDKALGPEHPHIANSLNNLANLYAELGNYTKATPLFRRALEIYEHTLGPEHPDTATSLNNLATLYTDWGKYMEAEPLFGRALMIRERILGPEHPDTATSLNNLANLYAELGDYTTAEPLYRRALAIRERILGPEHPEQPKASTIWGTYTLVRAITLRQSRYICVH